MSRSRTPLRIAIVGGGLMGGWHARYAERAGAEVVAIVDPKPAVVAAFRSRHRAARPFGDLAAMLDGAAPDGVHICTPTATHAELAATALRRRVHAMVEKPLGRRAAQTRQLYDIADAAGVLLCPVYQFPFQRGFSRACAWLEANAPPIRIDFTLCSAGAARLGPDADDALVRDMLPHPVSVLCALARRDRFDLSDWVATRRAPGELAAHGAVGTIDASVILSAKARPPRCEARILTARGTVFIDFFHGFAFAQRGGRGRPGKTMLPFGQGAMQAFAAARNLAQRVLAQEPAYPGLAPLIERFYATMRSGAPPPLSRAFGETVAAWCEHVEAAAAPRP